MSKLSVARFLDYGEYKWGLFYEDKKGKTRLLMEDFRQVAFRSEEEAIDRLEAMEREKRSEDAAPPFTIEEAQEYVEQQNWKYASTYAMTTPHEYIVKRWLDRGDWLQFERLVQTINTRSVAGCFHGYPYNYLILGNYYYWYMPLYPDNMAVDLINRSTIDYLEFRDGVYYYKENYRKTE